MMKMFRVLIIGCFVLASQVLAENSIDLSGRWKLALDRDVVNWHYPHYGNQGGFPGGIIWQGDWRVIEKFGGGVELFNLRNDLGEQTDLAMQEPERVQTMLKKLKKWQQDTGAVPPTKNPHWAP